VPSLAVTMGTLDAAAADGAPGAGTVGPVGGVAVPAVRTGAQAATNRTDARHMTTLTFGRMAADNEVTACSASGMSYARILAPIAALGLVLTMGLFYLSNFVVPGFYRAAAQTLENDLMSVLVTQLNQNRPFTEIPGIVIYADSARQYDPPPGSVGMESSPGTSSSDPNAHPNGELVPATSSTPGTARARRIASW